MLIRANTNVFWTEALSKLQSLRYKLPVSKTTKESTVTRLDMRRSLRLLLKTNTV
jgi:hypothetical protein